MIVYSRQVPRAAEGALRSSLSSSPLRHEWYEGRQAEGGGVWGRGANSRVLPPLSEPKGVEVFDRREMPKASPTILVSFSVTARRSEPYKVVKVELKRLGEGDLPTWAFQGRLRAEIGPATPLGGSRYHHVTYG